MAAMPRPVNTPHASKGGSSRFQLSRPTSLLRNTTMASYISSRKNTA